MLRIIEPRTLGDISWSTSAGNVWRSVLHPDRSVRQYGGTQRWLRNEVLPLSLRGERGGQWVPNYHLHLFGSGMTYARTEEWFARHGVAHPRVASGLTIYAAHYLNEMVENGTNKTLYNQDAMTDLLIFDAAAIVLWNQGWMRRAFTGDWEITNWNGQPTYSATNGSLENAYSLFMVRGPLPRTTSWKVMTTGGSVFLAGLSRRLGSDHWLSVAGGVIPIDAPIVDSATYTKTVLLQPNGGVFLDRNGSLLASVVGREGSTNGATLNVYPGVLWASRYAPGFWVQRARGGPDGHGVRFGVTAPFGLGLGAVSGRPR